MEYSSWPRLCLVSQIFTGWLQEGDAVLITSSDYEYSHADRASIAAVRSHADASSTITLEQPLQHSHLGSLKTYAGQAVDLRARVALLSRSLVISGTAGGPAPYVVTAGRTAAASVALSHVEIRGQVRLAKLRKPPGFCRLMHLHCA